MRLWLFEGKSGANEQPINFNWKLLLFLLMPELTLLLDLALLRFSGTYRGNRTDRSPTDPLLGSLLILGNNDGEKWSLVQFVKCWQFFWSWILKDCLPNLVNGRLEAGYEEFRQEIYVFQKRSSILNEKCLVFLLYLSPKTHHLERNLMLQQNNPGINFIFESTFRFPWSQ